MEKLIDSQGVEWFYLTDHPAPPPFGLLFQCMMCGMRSDSPAYTRSIRGEPLYWHKREDGHLDHFCSCACGLEHYKKMRQNPGL